MEEKYKLTWFKQLGVQSGEGEYKTIEKENIDKVVRKIIDYEEPDLLVVVRIREDEK